MRPYSHLRNLRRAPRHIDAVARAPAAAASGGVWLTTTGANCAHVADLAGGAVSAAG